MNPSVLLQKLIEIERSIGVETESTTRRRVLDAQDYVLRVHWGSEDAYRSQPVESRETEKFYLLRNLTKFK
jgi:hypothetical protein